MQWMEWHWWVLTLQWCEQAVMHGADVHWWSKIAGTNMVWIHTTPWIRPKRKLYLIDVGAA